MKFLSDLVTNKRAWQLLALAAFSLELVALYFQYGMGLEPCVKCIYQRNAIWAIFFAGVIGSIGCRQVFVRLIAYGLWATGAIWGLIVALEHVESQTAKFSFLFSCEFAPNFPSWLPLHEWIPALFAATGDCSSIDWQFLGYSMPQWMIVVYGLFCAAFALVFISRIQQTKMF